ncbi:unnamed protein product [Darwinula stevensoni]|uniref:Uncharacterized protein n=1 Tax=Darwinula stevensoni TaxID=69355 RepID=A0A7R9FQI8_9CRUS|nr:unnamed protein product [Darwinula stevensoni]CAG0899257.1 unnamed protein product [Darwinula stevensoni]
MSYWDEWNREQADEKPDSTPNVDVCQDGGGSLSQQVAAIALEEPIPRSRGSRGSYIVIYVLARGLSGGQTEQVVRTLTTELEVRDPLTDWRPFTRKWSSQRLLSRSTSFMGGSTNPRVNRALEESSSRRLLAGSKA